VRSSRAIVNIKNTGSLPGAQILQLYISAPESLTQRPVKELHGFEKVFLNAGEEKKVEITIDPYATSLWDESEEKWRSEKGKYTVVVSTSSSVSAGSVKA